MPAIAVEIQKKIETACGAVLKIFGFGAVIFPGAGSGRGKAGRASLPLSVYLINTKGAKQKYGYLLLFLV